MIEVRDLYKSFGKVKAIMRSKTALDYFRDRK